MNRINEFSYLFSKLIRRHAQDIGESPVFDLNRVGLYAWTCVTYCLILPTLYKVALGLNCCGCSAKLCKQKCSQSQWSLLSARRETEIAFKEPSTSSIHTLLAVPCFVLALAVLVQAAEFCRGLADPQDPGHCRM